MRRSCSQIQGQCGCSYSSSMECAVWQAGCACGIAAPSMSPWRGPRRSDGRSPCSCYGYRKDVYSLPDFVDPRFRVMLRLWQEFLVRTQDLLGGRLHFRSLICVLRGILSKRVASRTTCRSLSSTCLRQLTCRAKKAV